MNRKLLRLGLFILLVVVIFSFTLVKQVSAESTVTIKNSWLPYKTSFVVGGNNYSLVSLGAEKSNPDSAILFIKKNGVLVTSVHFGECSETKYYKYCFLDRSFENKLIDVDSKGVVQPAIRVSMVEYRFSNNLKFKRTISDRSIYLDGTTKITFSLVNDGDTEFRKVRLDEKIPSGFELVSKDPSLILVGDKLTTNFDLKPFQSWSSSYVLKPLYYNSSIKYRSVFHFINESGDEGSVYSSTDSISVRKPVSISPSLNAGRFDLGNGLSFVLRIQDTDDVDLEIDNLSIIFSNPLKQFKLNHLSYDGNNFFAIKDSLKPSDSISYQVSGKVKTAGRSQIHYSGLILVRGQVIPFSKTINYTVSTRGLSCLINASGDYSSGNLLNYGLTVKNTDNDDFYGLKGQFMIDGVIIKQLSEDVLKHGFSKYELSGKYKLPFSLKKYSVNLSFDGKYKSTFGEFFDVHCNKLVDIKPADKLVVVSYKQVPLEINSTNDLNLTLTNKLDEPIKVSVDYGSDSDIVSLKPLASVNESLSFFVPETYSSSTLSIPLKISILEKDYLDEENLQFKVSNPYSKKDVSSSNSSSDSSASTNSSNVKVTIFKKHPVTTTKGKSFWEQFVFLFKSIFG